MQASDLADPVKFWSVQFMEHGEFLYRLIDGDKYPQLKQQAKQEQEKWMKVIQTGNYSQVPALLQQLKLFKTDVLTRKLRGEDISPALYPSLVKHMLSELSYFERLLEGRITPEEELQFLLQEAMEHTKLAGLMLDPTEKTLIDKTLGMGEDLEIAADDPFASSSVDVYLDSNEAAIELYDGLQNRKVLAALTPKMLAHEIREGQYGATRLAHLNSLDNFLTL